MEETDRETVGGPPDAVDRVLRRVFAPAREATDQLVARAFASRPSRPVRTLAVLVAALSVGIAVALLRGKPHIPPRPPRALIATVGGLTLAVGPNGEAWVTNRPGIALPTQGSCLVVERTGGE